MDKKSNRLPRGIVRACAGIVAGVSIEPYTTYIDTAAEVVGEFYPMTESGRLQRSNLVTAIKLNLVSRKEYPFELLDRRYELAISLNTFKRERAKYCRRLAELCGFVRKKVEP